MHASTQTASPMVILLSPTSTPPILPKCTVYRVTENTVSQGDDAIPYARLIDMLFEADRVITW